MSEADKEAEFDKKVTYDFHAKFYVSSVLVLINYLKTPYHYAFPASIDYTLYYFIVLELFNCNIILEGLLN